ncbi:MAG TPA: response regulator transcription factor [Candidatus Sulfotelmatobacter sp.]|nr:response regulator transcription factor [Candidatus Sulfotelmatobacter sp.]
MKLPRVILADDHTLVLEALRKLLQPAYDVVATVGDGRALLELAPRLKPDVAVIDFGMPRLNGLDAGHQLKQVMPMIKLIFLTVNEDPELAREAMRRGASAYLLKKCTFSELIRSIETAMRGERYVTPEIAREMSESFIRDPQGKDWNKELTPRQREVLQLLAEGKSMKEVAYILGITARTVAFHKYRMMEDHRVKTSAELVRLGIKKHLFVA